MSAPLLTEIPAMPESFGESAGADEAQRALTENEPRDDDEPRDDNAELASTSARKPDGDSSDAPTTPHPEQSSRKSKSPAASSETVNLGAAAKPEKVSARSLKRLKRPVLEDRYLELHERAAKLESDNTDLHRRAAVVQAVGSDVISEGVTNMVGELVDLADNGAQLLTEVFGSATMARIVALEPDERARLVKLATPFARGKLGAYVEQSPALALAVGLGSIALGKLVAYKLAAHESRQLSLPLANGGDS